MASPKANYVHFIAYSKSTLCQMIPKKHKKTDVQEVLASTFSVHSVLQVVLFDFGSRGLGGRCGHREDPAAGSRFDHGVQFLSVGPNDAKQWKETWL